MEKCIPKLLSAPNLTSHVCEEGLKLLFYESKSYCYRSLYPNSEVLKITFNGLLCQYGHKDGGFCQLQEGMLADLSRFGTVCNSGTISRATGVFSGGGYAVLKLREFSDFSLSHEFHWYFSPLDDNNTYGQNRSCEPLVYAHWRSMPPYCRYCHSPAHAIADYPVKLSSIICYNCNRHGHMSRSCPRKSTHNNPSYSNKKAHKTPMLQVLVRDSVSSEPTLISTGVHGEASITPHATDVTATSDAFSTQTEIIANPTVTSTNSADIPVA
ncbi:hypothetical protein G6F37_009280 [Rhizopus arrhizus]|nr:hypothetical protein G6F38_010366 [Rhizopus arrhizus]KAG1154623.1 hypothetical protein G6F37_009280 [Rhizopus arrhizus]